MSDLLSALTPTSLDYCFKRTAAKYYQLASRGNSTPLIEVLVARQFDQTES